MVDTATTVDGNAQPATTLPLANMQAPREWCTLDIETRPPGSPEEIEAEVHRSWRPAKTWKTLTIGERYQQAMEKARGRRAVMDCAEIVIVSLKTPCELLVLHCFKAEPPRLLNGATVEGFASNADMLIALRSWLIANVDLDTTIIGHNLRFDLNKLRLGYARQGLRLPEALVVAEQSTCCTMSLFARRFMLSETRFVSLADACEMIGLEHHKDTLDGSQLEGMIAAGEFDTVLNYAALDVVLECNLWLRLTGQHPELK